MAFQAANGTQLGRHLVKNVGRKWRGGGCDGLPSLEISLESVESHAVPHSILPNHTEGHRLNGRDALSRKAGLRLGKDSTGVEASPNQDKLRRMNKYCRLQGLNRCPLAWELGTLPLDHLGFDLFGICHLFVASTNQGMTSIIKGICIPVWVYISDGHW